MTDRKTSLPIRVAAVLVLGACALVPVKAQAWWRGGVFIGVPPVVVAPPVLAYPVAPYYPPAYYPPAYYPPPPTYAQPPPQQTPAPELSPELSQGDVPYGSTCYAGVYVCAAPAQTRVGTGCTCPGLGAPSYGVVQ